MRQFNRLLYFEWTKIWRRKGTWITLGILLACHIAMEGLFFSGSTYVEGEFLETHLEGAKIDAENARRLSGRKINDELLQEMRAAYLKFADEDDLKYVLTEDYQKTARPYSMLQKTIGRILWEVDVDLLAMTEKQFYGARKEAVLKQWDNYKLSDEEKAYWQEKENQLTEPFTYQYAEGYNYLISMSGIYRVCLLVTFLIAICMSAVFTEEHSRKTDQLILCSRMGRRQIYAAKILAGSFFALLVTMALFLISIGLAVAVYGTDGFSAAIQLQTVAYSEAFTVGQVFVIMTGILFLSSVLVSIFSMVLSEVTGSSLAAMSVVIAVLFAARLVQIPSQYRVFSQIWNYLPINLLYFEQGFCDVRLVSILGLRLNSWEMSIILYAVLIIIFILTGKKVYCRYQIEGR